MIDFKRKSDRLKIRRALNSAYRFDSGPGHHDGCCHRVRLLVDPIIDIISSQAYSTVRAMKVYNFSCQHDHHFEGWFSSEGDFAAQLEKKLVSCPICDSQEVRRLPSAPRLNLSGAQHPTENDALQAIQKQWMEFARKVVENTEDVGDRFAEEARRMHYQESPMRGIRGTASADEFNALEEEGIDVMCLPLPDALKQSLQ